MEDSRSDLEKSPDEPNASHPYDGSRVCSLQIATADETQHSPTERAPSSAIRRVAQPVLDVDPSINMGVGMMIDVHRPEQTGERSNLTTSPKINGVRAGQQAGARGIVKARKLRKETVGRVRKEALVQNLNQMVEERREETGLDSHRVESKTEMDIVRVPPPDEDRKGMLSTESRKATPIEGIGTSDDNAEATSPPKIEQDINLDVERDIGADESLMELMMDEGNLLNLLEKTFVKDL